MQLKFSIKFNSFNSLLKTKFGLHEFLTDHLLQNLKEIKWGMHSRPHFVVSIFLVDLLFSSNFCIVKNVNINFNNVS